MWKAKRKLLNVEQVRAHPAVPSHLIRGRAPGSTELSFTPAELFGAMAQCSSRARMDQRAARAQVAFCKHLIAQHVDDINDRFALLNSARDLKDYVRKAMTGLVGDGIAYLQMVRDGYRWVDHFEGHVVHGKKPTGRSPDFIFSRSNDLYVALAESKATKGTSKGAFNERVEDGYKGQVEPYLGRKIGSWIASHGFAVGSWMTSVKRAEIFVHHTALPDPESSDGPDPKEGSDPTGVRFGSYCGVITLLFGPEIGEAARSRLWGPSEQMFSTVEWLGRTWILGEEVDAEAIVTDGHGKVVFKGTWSLWFNGLAIDLETAKRVFAYIEAEEPEARMLENIPEFDAELIEAAKESGAAIFPDGFAVLGRKEDLTEIQPGAIPPKTSASAVVKIDDIKVAESVVARLSYRETETKVTQEEKEQRPQALIYIEGE
ncbi:hypothetical protein [Rhizobium leguminosarum]|uniref:hypothetical protein n=1 Tax=Rhizobium leguminosarum TaxID=384 RepID=UPI001030D0AE|nr:hypothetical protein [Rhizobium leguminosarum]TBE37943.1 hypothetical protein ELH04_36995 [Rhizobium leguminosarum]